MGARGLAWGTAAVLVLGGVVAAPAQAVPPDRGTVTFSFDSGPELEPDLTAACGFEVTALTRGRLSETYFYDRGGNLRVIHSNPSMVTIYEGLQGASVETADRGLDKLSLTSDGTYLYFGTGIHLKVKGQDYSIGLWRLTFTDTFELVGQDYHGNFDVLYPDLVDYLCETLAG